MRVIVLRNVESPSIFRLARMVSWNYLVVYISYWSTTHSSYLIFSSLSHQFIHRERLLIPNLTLESPVHLSDRSLYEITTSSYPVDFFLGKNSLLVRHRLKHVSWVFKNDVSSQLDLIEHSVVIRLNNLLDFLPAPFSRQRLKL